MKITILNFEVAEVDTLELPAELAGAQVEALEGFIIGKGYSLGSIEWMQHEYARFMRANTARFTRAN